MYQNLSIFGRVITKRFINNRGYWEYGLIFQNRNKRWLKSMEKSTKSIRLGQVSRSIYGTSRDLIKVPSKWASSQIDIYLIETHVQHEN